MCEENLLTLGQRNFHCTRHFLTTRLSVLRAAWVESIRRCIRYKEILGTERFYPGLDPGSLSP